VTVNGNGPYDTSMGDNPGGFTLPTSGTVVGTYTWTAHYTPDNNNQAADDQGGSAEQVKYTAAKTTVMTSANPTGTIQLGTTAPTLNDSATLSGGYFPQGTLTFTVTGPGGTYTDHVTVNGNGSYDTSKGDNPGGFTLPTSGTVVGTYTWTAHYTPDANNLAADDQGGSAEQVMYTKASPTLYTVPGGTVAVGSGKLNDTATLTGGYYATGTITFKLYLASDLTHVLYTDVITLTGAASPVTVSTATMGNNAGGYAPTAAGTYQWVSSYSGDTNNKSANDQGGTSEQEVAQSGLTMGFYSNKNGQAVLTGSTTGTTLLGGVYNALFGIKGVTYLGITPTSNGVLVKPVTSGTPTNSVLVDNTGKYVPLSTLKSYSGVSGILAGYANATNMANMLSAQLLTLEFNIYNGYVVTTLGGNDVKIQVSKVGMGMTSADQHALTVQQGASPWTQVTTVDGGAASINVAINAAIAQLIANPSTVASGQNRVYQEALKCIFDSINNNQAIFI
jgi:hypothetical protein